MEDISWLFSKWRWLYVKKVVKEQSSLWGGVTVLQHGFVEKTADKLNVYWSDLLGSLLWNFLGLEPKQKYWNFIEKATMRILRLDACAVIVGHCVVKKSFTADNYNEEDAAPHKIIGESNT